VYCSIRWKGGGKRRVEKEGEEKRGDKRWRRRGTAVERERERDFNQCKCLKSDLSHLPSLLRVH